MRLLSIFTLITLMSLQANAGTLTQDFFTHQNIERNAWVYVPDNYDGSKAYPLVFAAHGLGNSAEVMIGITTFEELAEQDSFIVVWPEGKYTGQIFGHAWNVGLGFNQAVDDVGFIDILIDHYSTNFNVDPNRIFMSGFSQGGTLGYKYACDRPGVLRAIASSAGSMSNEIYNNCPDAQPTPVLHIHGTNDPIIFYNGLAVSYKSVAQTLAFWRNVNGCGDEPEITYLPNIYPDGYTVTLLEYNACLDAENEVIHFKLVNGFHTWPGAQGSNNDIDANVEIWEFFKRQGQDVVASAKDELLQSINVFPNPATDRINIYFSRNTPLKIDLYNSAGSSVLQEISADGPAGIELGGIPAGIYMLRFSVEYQSVTVPLVVN